MQKGVHEAASRTWMWVRGCGGLSLSVHVFAATKNEAGLRGKGYDELVPGLALKELEGAVGDASVQARTSFLVATTTGRSRRVLQAEANLRQMAGHRPKDAESLSEPAQSGQPRSSAAAVLGEARRVATFSMVLEKNSIKSEKAIVGLSCT